MATLLSNIFRQKVANSKDLSMKTEATETTMYPTGYLTVDFLNGYIASEVDPQTGEKKQYYAIGLADGSINEYIANMNTGKTTLVCRTAANIARRFPTSTIFEDITEAGGLTPERRRSLSGFDENEYRDRYIVRDSGITAESLYERIVMIHDEKVSHPEDYLYDTGHTDMYGQPIMKFEPTIYILDSLAELMPEKYLEDKEIAGKSMGAASALIVANVFRAILPKLKAANIIMLVINQILEDVNMTAMPKKAQLPYLKQGERLPKGKTVGFLASTIWRLDHASKLKEDEAYKFEGSTVDIALVKSRTSGRKASTRLVYDFVSGFDVYLSILRYLQDNKLIYGAGTALYFEPEKKYKFSQANFREQVATNKEFRDAFVAVAVEHLKKEIRVRDVLAKEYYSSDITANPALQNIL